MNFTTGLEELQGMIIRKSRTEQKIMYDWGIDEMPYCIRVNESTTPGLFDEILYRRPMKQWALFEPA
jgi:hypothetical protein